MNFIFYLKYVNIKIMNNKPINIFCKIEGCLLNKNIIIKSITDRINKAYDEGNIIVLLTNKPESDIDELINLLKNNNKI